MIVVQDTPMEQVYVTLVSIHLSYTCQILASIRMQIGPNLKFQFHII